MHTLVKQFIERVHAVDYTSVGTDPDPRQPITAKFQVTVRGWGDNTHQRRASSLLDMQENKMMVRMQKEEDILLIPRDWWPDKVHTLEPQEPDWWYVVSGGGHSISGMRYMSETYWKRPG